MTISAGAAPLDRPPLDVALVFDSSASMGEDRKISFTLAAAKLVVANLRAEDTLSIVAFDTEATILEPQQPVTRKLFSAHWFDELEPKGFTNLSGGLLGGLGELRRARRPNARARLIVLTDGLANRGLVDRDSLESIARRAGGEGIPISTIGVGDEFDAVVLQAIASLSGGTFAHVARGEGIPAAVAREIGGLQPPAAQNVELELVPAEGVELVEPAALDLPARAEPVGKGQPGGLRVGDLSPADRRSVFAVVRVSAAGPDRRPLLVARLRYDDAAGAPRRREVPVVLEVAADDGASFEAIDEALMGEIRLARLLDLIYQALEGRDARLARVARQRVEDGRRDLEIVASHGETETLREEAALVLHLDEELAKLEVQEKLHEHVEEEAKLERSEGDVRRFHLVHHRRADASSERR